MSLLNLRKDPRNEAPDTALRARRMQQIEAQLRGVRQRQVLSPA